jgi:hypothetical protein
LNSLLFLITQSLSQLVVASFSRHYPKSLEIGIANETTHSVFCFLLQFLINAANKLADAVETAGFVRFFGCFGWLGGGTGLMGTGAATATVLGTFSVETFFTFGEVVSSGTGGGDFL